MKSIPELNNRFNFIEKNFETKANRLTVCSRCKRKIELGEVIQVVTGSIKVSPTVNVYCSDCLDAEQDAIEQGRVSL